MKERIMDGILQILARDKHINEDDVGILKREFEKNETEYFEDFLIDEEIVEKDDLLKAMGEFFNVQPVDVLGAVFDHELLVKFPKSILLSSVCIPYYVDNNILFVITNDPSSDEVESILREYVSYDIAFFAGIPRHIDMMIKDFYEDSLYQYDYEDNIEESAGQD